MEVIISGIRYHISDTTKEFVEKKCERVHFAKEVMQGLAVVINKATQGYKVDFKTRIIGRGEFACSAEAPELYPAIELAMDKFEAKVRKEKC